MKLTAAILAVVLSAWAVTTSSPVVGGNQKDPDAFEIVFKGAWNCPGIDDCLPSEGTFRARGAIVDAGILPSSGWESDWALEAANGLHAVVVIDQASAFRIWLYVDTGEAFVPVLVGTGTASGSSNHSRYRWRLTGTLAGP